MSSTTETGTPTSRAEAKSAANRYPVVDNRDYAAYREARTKYRERDLEIRDEFAQDLAYEYLGGLSDRVARLVFAKAWDDGHASGFHAVEDQYEELARLCMLAVEETRGR